MQFLACMKAPGKNCLMLQDAKELMSQVRDLKFALEESDQAAEHLASELAAAQVSMLRRGN